MVVPLVIGALHHEPGTVNPKASLNPKPYSLGLRVQGTRGVRGLDK